MDIRKRARLPGYGCVVALFALLGTANSQIPIDAPDPVGNSDPSAAMGSLQRTLDANPANRAARLALIELDIRMARWEEAVQQVQAARERFPDDTQPVYLQAVIAFRRGNPQAAISAASECLDRGDRRSAVYKVLALAEYLLGRVESFETHLQAALEQNPRDAEAKYFLGRYLYETKRYGEALAALEAVLEMDPDHHKAHYFAGLIYGVHNKERAQGEFLAAIRIIEQKELRYAWPYLDLGRQLVDAGDRARGLEWLSRAIRNDPANPKAHYEYARALLQQSASPQVEKALLEAIHLDPGYAGAFYLLAQYYRKAGRSNLATEALARFSELKANPVPSAYGLRR